MVYPRSIFIFWMVLLVLLLQHASLLLAGPVGFTGSWRYFESGGDVEDTYSFIESYNLDFGKDLSDGMHFSSAVRYNDIQRDEGNDSIYLQLFTRFYA